MAGQTFDFELRADDQVSGALKKISGQVKSLQPELTETEKGLKLGGQETQDELSDVNAAFKTLGRFAKDNVQFIGDMVPPLRNFLGNAGKMGGMVGKFGLAGGAAYVAGKGIAALGGGMAAAAHDAYSLQIAAENAGMSVKDFSQLSGAMRLLGSDSESAQGSVEGLYKTFNDALQGRNSAALAIMNQINAPIVRNTDGTANVLKTVEKLAEVMPRLSPQNQKTVADALGLDENVLQLLREGVRLKERLAKADAIGLTVDPEINNQLVQFDRSLKETSAAWDGLKQRTMQGFYKFMLSDGSVKNVVEGWGDLAQHGPDNIAVMHSLDMNNTRSADMMREGYKHPDFMNSLSTYEKVMLDFGLMTEGFKTKYQDQIGLKEQAEQLRDDISGITTGYRVGSSRGGQSTQGSGTVNPQALSVLNNNPWNINYAGQAGAVPAGRFARFPTPEAGVQAADRQLQLYATGKSANVDHPLTTLAEIINKASPRSDGNDPVAMTQGASSQLGVGANESLNLNDIRMRSRVLSALFNQEGNNPFSAEQIEQIIGGNRGPGGALNAPTGPSLVSAATAPGSKAGSADDVARAVSEALKENGMKLEVTFINPATGNRQTMTATGGKVTTAMPFPG